MNDEAASPSPSALQRLQLVVLGSIAGQALRFLLSFAPSLLPRRLADSADVVLDMLGLALLAALAVELRALRAHRLLRLAGQIASFELALEILGWSLSSLGLAATWMPALAVVAQLLWVAGRSTLWLGLERGPMRSVVPALATARLLLFAASLLSPYLESGGDARRIFLHSAAFRTLLAFALLVAVDGAIAWRCGGERRKA